MMGKTINKNNVRRLLQKEGWVCRRVRKKPGDKEREGLMKDFVDSLGVVIENDPDLKRRIFEKVLLDSDFEKMIVEKLRGKE